MSASLLKKNGQVYQAHRETPVLAEFLAKQNCTFSGIIFAFPGENFFWLNKSKEMVSQ